jgi:hypothetical protein
MYHGSMRKAPRYAVATAAILAILVVTATGWVRDQRAAAVAVVILILLIGTPALAALGKALGDEFNRWR